MLQDFMLYLCMGHKKYASDNQWLYSVNEDYWCHFTIHFAGVNKLNVDNTHNISYQVCMSIYKLVFVINPTIIHDS